MTDHNYENLAKDLEGILREMDANDTGPQTRSAHEFSDEVVDELSRIDVGPTLYGWPKFTEMFGPFRPREFTVLCGTSGTGKTTLLANMSAQLMAGTVPHFVASVETGSVDYILRVLSVFEGRDINTGDPMPREQAQKLVDKWQIILRRQKAIFAPYTTKVNPKRVLGDLLYANRKLGCRVAFIDNLNFLMPIVNGSDAVSAMDRVVHDFIVFCKNIDMHIVMVMHPRKREDDSGSARVENEYDIKGSSTVIQEAHNVLLFNRPTKGQAEDGWDQSRFRELKFAKLRRRGKFSGKRIMFQSLETKYFEAEVL